MLRIQQIKLSLDESVELLPLKLIKKLRIPKEELLSWRIYKESLDARKETDVHFTYCLDCKVRHEDAVLNKHIKDVTHVQEYHYVYPKKGIVGLRNRPVWSCRYVCGFAAGTDGVLSIGHRTWTMR